jgi:hypothetical protein
MSELFQQYFETRRQVRSMTQTWETHFGTFKSMSLIINLIRLLRSFQCVGNHEKCKNFRKTRRMWTVVLKPEGVEEQIGKLLRSWKTAPKLLLLAFLRILSICWQLITFLQILRIFFAKLSTYQYPLSIPYWDNRLSFGFLTTEDGTDMLSRNVCKKSTLLAAL